MARIRDIVVDCRDPAALARFWAQVLDGYAVRAYDRAEIERLAALGFTPETDPQVAVDGPGPTLFFQKMDPLSTGRSRWHVDLAGAAPRAQEIPRLIALGARVREHRDDWSVLLDPEDNAFCLRDPD